MIRTIILTLGFSFLSLGCVTNNISLGNDGCQHTSMTPGALMKGLVVGARCL